MTITICYKYIYLIEYITQIKNFVSIRKIMSLNVKTENLVSRLDEHERKIEKLKKHLHDLEDKFADKFSVVSNDTVVFNIILIFVALSIVWKILWRY